MEIIGMSSVSITKIFETETVAETEAVHPDSVAEAELPEVNLAAEPHMVVNLIVQHRTPGEKDSRRISASPKGDTGEEGGSDSTRQYVS